MGNTPIKCLLNKATIFAVVAVSLFAQAATPPQQIILETAYVVPVKPVESGIKAETVSKFIPMNFAPSAETEQTIGIKIVDYNANNFLQGEYFKNTELGKVSAAIENTMKTDVVIGKEEDGSYSHKFNMQVLAFERRALFKYDGFVHMDFNYNSILNNWDIALNQTIGATNLSLGHSTLAQYSSINLSWGW